jgi:hypothetical protein
MQEIAHVSLSPWESYYVIVGSSAAALTGLQFVVLALLAEVRRKIDPTQLGAFASPTIVHFCAVLLVSAVLSAPWETLGGARLILAALGAGGVVYALIVTARARRQTDYKPVLEDWTWHSALPFVAYAAIGLAAVVMERDTADALFVVGGATLLLIFVGIHNAWDTVTFVVSGQLGEVGEAAEAKETAAAPS